MQDVATRRMGRPQSREEARMKYSIRLEASAGNSREQRAAPESVKPSLSFFQCRAPPGLPIHRLYQPRVQTLWPSCLGLPDERGMLGFWRWQVRDVETSARREPSCAQALTSIPSRRASAVCWSFNWATRLSEKSSEVPGPRLVVMFPSTTTLSSEHLAPSSPSSKPG